MLKLSSKWQPTALIQCLALIKELWTIDITLTWAILLERGEIYAEGRKD